MSVRPPHPWRGVLLVLLMLFSAALACTKKAAPSEVKPASQRAAPRKGLTVGDGALMPVIRQALGACSLSDFGTLHHCAHKEDQALAGTERSLGVPRSLLTYCHALEDRDHRVQLLAANRINRLGSFLALREEPDPQVLRCLLHVLPDTRKSLVLRPLTRVATYLATALGQEEALLKALAAHPEELVREEGFRALWPNGRRKLLPRLAQELRQGTSSRIRHLVLQGFARGGPLSQQEEQEVCALLLSLLQKAGEPQLASAATESVAHLCPVDKDSVLSYAEQQLASYLTLSHESQSVMRRSRKKRKSRRRATAVKTGNGTALSSAPSAHSKGAPLAQGAMLSLIRAIQAINGQLADQTTATQRARSVRLLQALQDHPDIPTHLQATALQALATIDRRAGRKAAQKHGRHKKNPLYLVAKRILGRR